MSLIQLGLLAPEKNASVSLSAQLNLLDSWLILSSYRFSEREEYLDE